MNAALPCGTESIVFQGLWGSSLKDLLSMQSHMHLYAPRMQKPYALAATLEQI